MLGDKEDKETIWPCQEATRALFSKGLMNPKGESSLFCFEEEKAPKPPVGMGTD